MDHRYGDGRAHLLGIAVCDPQRRPISVIPPDSEILVRVSFRANQNLARPIVGLTFRDHRGLDIAGSNTDTEGRPLPPLVAGQTCTVDFYLQLPALYTNSLSISPAVADGSVDQHSVCDWIDNAQVLEMEKPEGPIYGHLRFPCRIEVNAPIPSPEPTGAVIS